MSCCVLLPSRAEDTDLPALFSYVFAATSHFRCRGGLQSLTITMKKHPAMINLVRVAGSDAEDVRQALLAAEEVCSFHFILCPPAPVPTVMRVQIWHAWR